MKLRSILTLAAGIGIGIAVANKLHEDDPDVVRGPQRSQSSGGPPLSLVTNQGRRIADQAGVMSLSAIRKARGAIRERLADYQHEEDAAWN